jgi:hypothetical protein
MNSCPVDYTDLDMVPIGQHQQGISALVFPRTPIIDGYMTGLAGVDAKFRFRFDIVVEYVPNMDLRSMVQVSNAVADTTLFEKSINNQNDRSYFSKATDFMNQTGTLYKAGIGAYNIGSQIANALPAGLKAKSPTGLPVKAALQHKAANDPNIHITGHGFDCNTIPPKTEEAMITATDDQASVISDDLKPPNDELSIKEIPIDKEKDNTCNVSEYVTTMNTKHIRAKNK